jgi:hypothetical protein
MIRAATFLIVLSLAGTPTAASLCIAWCGAQTSRGSTGGGCHQAMTTGGASMLVTKEHGCGEFLQGAPFVREDPLRAASGSASDHVVIPAQHRFHYQEAVSAPESVIAGRLPALRESHPTVLRL